MVDPTKPLRFKNDPRPVTLIGTMPNGDIVVVSTYDGGNLWPAPEVFDPVTGIARRGFALALENAPVVKSGFFALDGGGDMYGRGFIKLDFAKEEHPSAKHFLEIIREDGIPIDAKVHAR